jgi:hypothetical protein
MRQVTCDLREPQSIYGARHSSYHSCLVVVTDDCSEYLRGAAVATGTRKLLRGVVVAGSICKALMVY